MNDRPFQNIENRSNLWVLLTEQRKRTGELTMVKRSRIERRGQERSILSLESNALFFNGNEVPRQDHRKEDKPLPQRKNSEEPEEFCL